MTSSGRVGERRRARLMKIPGVVGVAVGASPGGKAVYVYVEEDTARIRREVPASLDGLPVIVVVSGRFTARGSRP